MADIKTLDDIINYKSQYDIRNVLYLNKVDGLIYAGNHLFDKYKPILKSYIQKYNVNESERTKYNYKPDVLSNLIYKTPDLAWLILYLNDIESPSRFKMPKVLKLIPMEDLDTIYNLLLTKNTEQLEKNKLSVEG